MGILYTIFGWLLGLLSQPIVSRIEKYYKRGDVKTAIFSELKNLLVRLAGTCMKIEAHLGTKDKESLRWLKAIYEEYRVECPQNILDAMDKLLQVPDDQFKKAVQYLQAGENDGMGLRRFSLSFTDSILESLSVFDPKFQSDILEIRTQVGFLNELVEDAMFYFRLTFDPDAIKINSEPIRNNMNNCYRQVGDGCRRLVEKIQKVLKA